MTQGTTPPGWYDDGQGAQRWWDGTQWTEHTQPSPGGSATPAEAEPPAEPPQPGIHDDITRFGTPPPSQGGAAPSSPQLDKPAGGPPSGPPPGSPPAGPSADVTMVRPAGSFPTPGQQPGFTPPATPGYGTPAQGGYTPPGQPPAAGGGYGAPAWQNQFPASGGGGGGGKGKLFALIGGGVGVVVIVLILLFVFVLGGSGGPKGTVEDFADAVQDGDCSVVEFASNKALGVDKDSRDEAVEAAKALCESDDSFSSDAEGCDVEVGDVNEDGDKATVEFTVSGCDDDSDNEEGSLDLVKEDGDWRIDNFSDVE